LDLLLTMMTMKGEQEQNEGQSEFDCHEEEYCEVMMMMTMMHRGLGFER